MKKTISILFVLALLIPLFMGEYSGIHVISDESGGKLSVRTAKTTEEIDQYISENFGFRKELIYANAFVDSRVFRSSSNSDVVVGKSGWLYLAETLQVPNILDWSGVGERLKELEIRAAANGAALIVVLAPDKRSIYPEFLPDRFSDWRNENYQRLVSRLIELNVTVVDLKSSLLAQKGLYQLYSLKDTHWNRLAAFLAFKEVLNAIDVETEDFASLQVYTRSGDLSRLLGLNEAEEVTAVALPPKLSGEKLGTLILYHDSFGESLLPFFEKTFARIEPRTIDINSPFEISDEELRQADVLIVEIVERDLPTL